MTGCLRSRRFGRRSARVNGRRMPGHVAEVTGKVAVTGTVFGASGSPCGGAS